MSSENNEPPIRILLQKLVIRRKRHQDGRTPNVAAKGATEVGKDHGDCQESSISDTSTRKSMASIELVE